MNLIKSDLIWEKFGPSYTCKPNVDRISTTTNESLGPKRAIWPNNSVADKVVIETNAKEKIWIYGTHFAFWGGERWWVGLIHTPLLIVAEVLCSRGEWLQ